MGASTSAGMGRCIPCFGAKPQRTPCSAEALRKRVLKDGSMPAIDPIVDLYNAISLRYAIPVGGENLL
jgi:DNA/RNA-binding domain of Phe-tRNA-synthetase-like protein